MNELTITMPTQRQSLNLGEFAETVEIIVDEPTRAAVNFLEANTEAITIEELATKCVVPTRANMDLLSLTKTLSIVCMKPQKISIMANP